MSMTQVWQQLVITPSRHVSEQTWNPLNLLNCFRLALATACTALVLSEYQLPPLGKAAPELFMMVATTYLMVSLIFVLTLKYRFPNHYLQTYLQMLTDITAVSLLMYASGGKSSGLGMLMIVFIASSNIVLKNRNAFAFPFLASFAIFAEQAFGYYRLVYNDMLITESSLYALTFFAASLITHLLVKRIQTTEALAQQQGIDIANLNQLNQHIVQFMQAGVLVVDEAQQIHLMNHAAWCLAGRPSLPVKAQLKDISPSLAQSVALWIDSSEKALQPLSIKAGYPELNLQCIQLKAHPHSGLLIFMEDSSLVSQRAQQMKLASLGRLTASIAHEIRNPLAAISHAEQLLAESPNLSAEDRRFTVIIRNHTQRVNGIIENILQLSRRGRTLSQEVLLLDWLQEFKENFCLSQEIDAAEISLNIDPPHTKVQIDTGQIQQVLWNLCQNGLYYSQNQTHSPKLELRGGLSLDLPHPFLDIIDHGSGIDQEAVQHIFEPFFTTEAHGTGLGLYIARELCECNQAQIEYLPVPSGGSCFRIYFSSIQARAA